MTEEKVTLTILKELKKRGWNILAFDSPQSGTGKVFYSELGEKNIPDIIAQKGNDILFFENKDRFVYSDFVKISEFVHSSLYKESVNNFLKNVFGISSYVGYSVIGMPKPVKVVQRYEATKIIVDLIIHVTTNGIEIGYKSVSAPEL